MRPLGRSSDPAPSRLAYRLDRLMLTPLFRFSLRVVLPMVVAFGAATAWFADETRRADFLDGIDAIRAEIEARPEFTVTAMAIDGTSEPVGELVRAALPVDFPISSFDLDLDRMREDVVALSPVKSARLSIRQGGVLQVDVEERQPVALWRGPDGLELIDRDGIHIGLTEGRAAWPELPVMAGEGADAAVKEALALVSVTRPIAKRFRGLVRVGERRWDVVLDRDQRIFLPEDGAVQALERVLAMDGAVDLLDRDVTVVDLRIPRRPILRMTDYASQELIKIKNLALGDQ